MNNLKANLVDFSIAPSDVTSHTTHDNNQQMTLLTRGTGVNKTIVSSDSSAFAASGLFYVAPNITDADEQILRAGDALATKISALNFSYRIKNNINNIAAGTYKSSITIKADDATRPAGDPLVGDRALSNPGYSAFTLSGNITTNAVTTDAQSLDIWRVEQRLKYLAFPAMGLQPTANSNQPEFMEDGTYNEGVRRALQLFDKVVHYSALTPNFGNLTYTTLNQYASSTTVASDVSWLNAYNAPHWVQFFKSTATGFSATNEKLGPQWINFQTSSKGEVFGTSWAFDLMVMTGTSLKSLPADNALAGRNPLIFDGAGQLGMAVNLKINTSYISQKNQAGVEKNELLFGLDKNGGGVTPELNTTNWNYQNSVALASLLKNPSVKATTTGSDALSNSQGINNQTQSLLDFLSVYNATQNDGQSGHGSLSDQTGIIQSGSNANDKKTIFQALFGDGTQLGGIVDSQHVLIGGLAANGGGIDSQLTAATLEAFMGTKEDLSDWVAPLNSAMRDFNIDTPARVAAFLTNVSVETRQLSSLTEAVYWSKIGTLSKVGAFRNKSMDILVAYLAKTGIEQANYAYANKDGNGPESSGDGYKYRGRGLLQITHKDGYARAQNGGLRGGGGNVRVPGLNQLYPTAHYDFLSNPDSIASDKLLAARIGAWYWVYGAGGSYGDLNAVVDRTSNTAEENFRRTAMGVKGSVDDSRVALWQKINAKIYDQNAYGNMRSVLSAMGITGLTADGYNKKFGINLRPLTLVEISDGKNHQDAVTPTDPVHSTPVDAIGSSDLLTDINHIISTVPSYWPGADATSDGVTTQVSTLPSGELGITTNSVITISNTASGGNWYYGTSNDDFLPTSDPAIWIAKPGSPADGKYDLLTVVLHEYGHILGLSDTSSGAETIMTGLLPVGVRRLPVNMLQTSVFAAQALNENAPIKAAATTSQMQTSRQTQSSTNNAIGQSDSNATNWSLNGAVISNESVFTLSESPETQSRISKTIIIGANDRFLTFKLSNLNIQGGNNLPNDAFEASLINASTSTTAINTIGLSETNALLNLQGDAQSFLSQNATVIVNPDGSRTYTVDLRGIPVGTAVNLSFDLIGFGPTGSQVTVSDVALMGLPQANDDTAQGNEDSPLTLDVLGNDLNAGGYQPVIVSAPAHGQLTLNANGSFSYVPQALYYGTDSFSYQLSNSLAQSNIATVSLNIAHVNHAPKANDVTLNLLEDGSVVIGLQDQSTDVDGDTQTLRIVSGPQHGSLTQNADGTFTYVPATLFYGSDSFTYVSNDGALDSNVATVNLVVGHVNHAPTAQAISLETLEEQAINGNLLKAGADVDGDVLTAKIVKGPQFGSLSLNADGTFTYLPNDLYRGTDTFSYLLNDGVLDSAVATVTITMAPVNHAPTVSSSGLLISLAEDGSANFNLLAGAQDVDGDALSVRITANPQHGTLQQQVDGTFSYVPNALFFGTDSLRYVVNDGSADSAERTVSLTVTHVNHAPVAQDVNLQTREEQAINGSLVSSASDVDGDTLSFNLVNGPQHGTVTLNADGTFAYTPAALYRGTDTFSYRSNDGSLDSAVATVTITMTPVNHAPTVSSSDLLITLAEDGSANFNLLTGASDVDGDALSVRIVANPQHGNLQQQADGTFSYVPNALFFGTDSLRYVVNDGSADSAERTVSFTVTHVNHAPVAQDVNLQTLEEQAINGSLVSSANDVDGDTLSFNLVNGPQHGTVKLNADGTFTYSPTALYRGTDTFSYRLNDGSLMSNVATVTLTMTPVNHAPKAKDAALQLAEDGQLQLDLLAYGSDPDGDALTSSVVNGPTHGSLQRNADGSYRYVPVGYFAGTDSFTYRLNDGSADSNTGTVTLTITPVNHAAQAQNDSATTDQGKAVIINVLANDSDIDNSTGAHGSSPLPANAGLTVKLVNQPANGKVTLNTDGTLTYTPNATFSGTDSFSYVANDGQVDSALAAVTITVKATNHVPVANDDQYTGKQGAALNFNPQLNDTDADGDALSIVLVSNPAHGQLTRNADGSLTYVPTANWSGTDTLTYEVSDGKSLSNVATVKLVITPGNQAPVAANDQVSLHNNQTAVINVLANDSDADGDKLTTRLVGNAKHGTVTHNADGSFSYTAQCGYTGSDSFTYLANDGKADSNLAQVNITVLGLNLPPLAFDDLAFVDENKAVNISPQANDWDINGDTLTARVLCLPSHGSLSLNSDGSYTYTPAKNWYGVDAFTYQAFDGQFYSNPAMVYIKVNRVDLAPVALNDSATVQAGQGVNLNVLANDYDPDGDALVATVTSSPKHGTLSKNRDGSFTYVAKAGYVGTDTFTYVANDGYLDSAAATVTLTILAPNRPPVAHDDQAATLVNTAVRINVLANDSDPDGDALSARIVCAPSHGRLSLNADGSFLYTPDSNWRGTDAFSYRASDGQALSDVAQVCISVTAPNRAPTAKNATYQLPQNGNLRIDFAGLVSDADNDNLTLTLNSPAKGTLTRNKDGSYSYQPKANFIGTDTFTYTVSDGKLSTTATVTLNVLKDRNCAASLVISSGAQGSGVASQSVLYRVINQNGGFVYVPDTSTTTVVDWSTQGGSNDDCSTGDDWWDVLFQSTGLAGDLRQLTGLVIKR